MVKREAQKKRCCDHSTNLLKLRLHNYVLIAVWNEVAFFMEGRWPRGLCAAGLCLNRQRGGCDVGRYRVRVDESRRCLGKYLSFLS